jgi:hypothetical protein
MQNIINYCCARHRMAFEVTTMQSLSPEILALPAGVEMTIGEWNTVMALLAEHPFKIVAPVHGLPPARSLPDYPARRPGPAVGSFRSARLRNRCQFDARLVSAERAHDADREQNYPRRNHRLGHHRRQVLEQSLANPAIRRRPGLGDDRF